MHNKLALPFTRSSMIGDQVLFSKQINRTCKISMPAPEAAEAVPEARP